MDLDELTVRQTLDDAGLATVQHLVVVPALEAEADPLGDDEGEDRDDEEADPDEPGDRVDRQVEVLGEHVVATADEEHDVLRDPGDTEGRTGRDVARAVQDVVLALVPGDPGLDERPDGDRTEHQREEQQRDEHAQDERVAPQVDLPAGHGSDQAFRHTHVPVGLRTGGHVVRAVRAERPDRVDRGDGRDGRDDTEDQEEEASGLGHVDRQQRHADDVVVRLAGTRELGVLVVEDQDQVGHQQAHHDAGQQQDVHRVEPRDEVAARELPAEQEHRQVRADDRDGQDGALHEADTGTREQVVRQRVTGEAGEHAEDQQQEAEDPVDLTGLAERAGEEDAHHVHDHRRDEDQRRPVVDLTDQQATADVEADVQRRGEGLGHHDALHRHVRAVVHDLVHARVEEQRQVHTREDDDDEAVEADLTQHEGPVVREDLAHVGLGQAVDAQAAVRPVRYSLAGRRFALVVVAGAHPRSQNAGPTGSSKSPSASRKPSSFTPIRSCGSA